MNSEADKESHTGHRAARLRVFGFGPGVGESIVIQLPCGRWGVIDCFQLDEEAEGTLRFLKRRKVKSLEFVCFTHPHQDHYAGAHLLLKQYAGRVRRIWRHPGFSKRDVTKRVLLGARVLATRSGDPEAEGHVEEYLRLLAAIDDEKTRLRADGYRRVIAPATLLEHRDYRVYALGPDSSILDEVERQIARFDASKGFLMLNENQGDVLNALSVVTLIRFGRANVFLLADAQGPESEIHPTIRKCAMVKIAHHGSENGLGAMVLCRPQGTRYSIDHAVLTAYSRSGLPAARMVSSYSAVCGTLLRPGTSGRGRATPILPGIVNARPAIESDEWVGVEIDRDGNVHTISG